MMGLDTKMTMERFVWPGDIGARLRLERSRYVKKASHATLFVLAPKGFGKTHLLQAIAQDEAARDGDLNIIYLTAAVWNKRVREKRTDILTQILLAADVLLIDEVMAMESREGIVEIVARRAKALRRTVIAAKDRQEVLRAGLGGCFDPTHVIEFRHLTPSQVRRLIAQKAADFGLKIDARQERRLATYRYRDVIDVMSVVCADTNRDRLAQRA